MIIQNQITIEPFLFCVGGLGAVAVGSVSDEYHARHADISEFAESTVRSLSYPLRCVVRFFAGGLVFVLMDTFLPRIMPTRIPAVAGAATAMCFANTSRIGVFLGSVLGMALFCQVADMLYKSSR